MFTPMGRRLTNKESLRSKRRRCAVMTMRCVTEGLSAKGTEGTRSAYIRIRAKAGVAEVRSDRLSVEELAPQTVSRPAVALSRRQTRSE